MRGSPEMPVGACWVELLGKPGRAWKYVWIAPECPSWGGMSGSNRFSGSNRLRFGTFGTLSQNYFFVIVHTLSETVVEYQP